VEFPGAYALEPIESAKIGGRPKPSQPTRPDHGCLRSPATQRIRDGGPSEHGPKLGARLVRVFGDGGLVQPSTPREGTRPTGENAVISYL